MVPVPKSPLARGGRVFVVDIEVGSFISENHGILPNEAKWGDHFEAENGITSVKSSVPKPMYGGMSQL